MIDDAETLGDIILEIATMVRPYKSERNLSLGTKLKRLQLATDDPILEEALTTAKTDLMSITRAQQVEITAKADPVLESCAILNHMVIHIESEHIQKKKH